MSNNDLDHIFENDELGILDIPEKQDVVSTDDRLLVSFEEINDFIDVTGRSPEPGKDIQEIKLYKRLQGIKANSDKVAFLKEYDRHSILETTMQIESVDDILAGDDFDLLKSTQEDEIFTLRNVPKTVSSSDFVARRKKCQDFGKFEQLFKECHEGLKNKTLGLKFFSDESKVPGALQHQIQEGRFFVDQGLLVYIAKIEDPKNVFGRMKSRMRCIYENGTESNMFLRSLSSQLYNDGKVVYKIGEEAIKPFEKITTVDQSTGYIYVLRSLSENEEIKSIDNLFKIGYSVNPVEQRIANAINDPTYFMAPVEVVSVYKCFNLNPQKFEALLHKFFGQSRLDTEIVNKSGMKHSANEWFVVPFEVIDQAIELIISGNIIDYRYDSKNEEIIISEAYAKIN